MIFNFGLVDGRIAKVWISDKFGDPINTKWLISLYVDSDGSGGYEVKGNAYSPTTASGSFAAQFTNGSAMTQSQAQALLAKMADLLGTFNPAA